MEKYEGKSILKRTAIGKMRFYSRESSWCRERASRIVDAELARYEQAKEQAVEQLHGLYEKLSRKWVNRGAIFDVHPMMLGTMI